MKIICLIDSLGSGGAQRQMVELSIGFTEKGHELSFITYYNDNFFKQELDKHNILVCTIIEPNYVKRLFKIRRAIRKQKPNAVLSFLEAANFIATFAGFPSRKWKLVVGERSANPGILNNKKLRLYRMAHFFADYVVANSHKNLEFVKMIIPWMDETKLKVIYNFVKIHSQHEYSISESRSTNIVIAASYRAVKNLDGLIQALQLLSDEYKSKLKVNWYGNIINENKYFIDQMEKIERNNLGNILTLFHQTNDIGEKYANADFVGLFSHYEGFPNTLCEAMAMSKPVIISSVSDVPLLVKEDENGFLFDSKKPEHIKNALIKAIDSTYEQRVTMGKNNYEVAKKEFNREIIVNQYLKLFGHERRGLD